MHRRDAFGTPLPLAIKEVGLVGIPEPPEPFRERVRALLDEATAFNRRELRMGRSTRVPDPVPNNGRKWGRNRGCVGCGGDLDEVTPGCENCVNRHEMRAIYARRREAAAASR